MFGRPRSPGAAPPAGTRAPSSLRFAADPGVVALSDPAQLARQGSIQAFLSRSLQGRAGTAYGHDRGAPERSLTGALAGDPGHGPVMRAIGQVYAGQGASARPSADYAQMAFVDPAMDPYGALMWNRLVVR